MKFICIAAMAIVCYSCQRRTAVASRTAFTTRTVTDTRCYPMLLGEQPKTALQQQPFNNWFNKNYSDYSIDSSALLQLRPLLQQKKFEIFMGTWCGDSKREVPRMYKLLENSGVLPSQIKLIMVDDHDSTYKQSPSHEEKGLDIHRVPVLIVYDGKKEINRVVESPVVSLEQDLLAIVKYNNYQPNYAGANYLAMLVREKGLPALMNDSTELTAKLKTMVPRSNELNTLGNVWMAAGELEKALITFKMNAALFPLQATVYNSLGEIFTRLDNKATAKYYYQQAMAIDPTNAHATKMLAQLD